MPESGKLPEPDFVDTSALMPYFLPISQKVVLVIDVVESVRLMAADEAGAVARWHDFAQYAQAHTIPQHQGRLVKSLGDGLMVEFEQPRQAVNAALAMHEIIAKGNATLASERQMHLRAGVNATHVYTDHNDIFGAGVNLAARLATLAGPGETVVSASARDGLTDGLDANLDDLGECYLKHLAEPVRAYRVGAAGAAPVVMAQRDYQSQLQPTVAVIPFSARSNEAAHFSIGELIADGVIASLSQCMHLRVMSRLSTSALKGNSLDLGKINAVLGTQFTLSGAYICVATKTHITWELAETLTHQVLLSDRATIATDDLLEAGSDFYASVSNLVQNAIINLEVVRVNRQPMPTLQSYSLLLSGVSLMHRSEPQVFDKSYQILNHLIDRHPALAQPKAWLAKWYVLRSVAGVTAEPQNEGARALSLTQRAIELDPGDSMSLSMQGYVYNHLLGNPDLAQKRLDDAIAINPNDSLAWLYKSVVLSMWGDSKEAVAAAARALTLSPLDPLLYFFHSLGASALLANGQAQQAIAAAQKSLRLNRLHLPTYRVLLTAQVMAGDMQQALATTRQLVAFDPGFSLANYEQGANIESRTKRQTILALKELGIR